MRSTPAHTIAESVGQGLRFDPETILKNPKDVAARIDSHSLQWRAKMAVERQRD